MWLECLGKNVCGWSVWVKLCTCVVGMSVGKNVCGWNVWTKICKFGRCVVNCNVWAGMCADKNVCVGKNACGVWVRMIM